MSKREAARRLNGASIVRQNKWPAGGLRWARSATKHRISRGRSRYVIERCVLVFDEEAPTGDRVDRDPRVVLLGDDAGGVALEVIGIELEDESLLVIHAMPLRERYRRQYEEAKKCQE